MPERICVPVSIDDPVNSRILAVSEDRVQGFHRDPVQVIADRSGVDVETVIERIRAMLQAGVIRRVRQTLLATNLAPGALVAWKVPADRLHPAFDWLFENDPFSGHVVTRSTDKASPGSDYRLWTTLKVPVGYSMQKHGKYLQQQIGAEDFVLLPARKVFALGVGHVRRRGIAPGARSDKPGRAMDVSVVELSDHEWQVLVAMKGDFAPDQITTDLWRHRATEAGIEYSDFCRTAESLSERRVIGRFSTFLEHAKTLQDGTTVSRYNALFHWAVPPGREVDAGTEVGRHICMTHAYWREGGPKFNHVNIMGVSHGTEKETVLAHKAAIDAHLQEAGIEVRYTNVFWGGRSEIKPSEISPQAYVQWCAEQGLDPEQMRA